jgi:hypothetical protein
VNCDNCEETEHALLRSDLCDFYGPDQIRLITRRIKVLRIEEIRSLQNVFFIGFIVERDRKF